MAAGSNQMTQAATFRETLRRLAIFDAASVEAGLGLDQASVLGSKTVAPLQAAVSAASGSSAVYPNRRQDIRAGAGCAWPPAQS
jgi:hypothetical protein